MKRCPSCQRTYPDDAPGFCVNDGAPLVTEESQGFDPQKTILASAPPPPPAQYAPPQPPPPRPPQAQYPPPPPPAQQQAWPPPPPPQQQQQQNWGGGYYPQPGQQPYGMPYAQPAGTSNTLSMTALILGCVSGLVGFLVFADWAGWINTISSRSSAQAMILAAFAPGVASLIIGVMALISRRQRSKVMAIIGMILSAAAIAFCIYLETEYGIFF